VVHWVHPSPERKWQLDRFSSFFQDSLVWQTDRATDRPTDHATRTMRRNNA